MATRYVLLLKGNVPRDLNVINLTAKQPTNIQKFNSKETELWA